MAKILVIEDEAGLREEVVDWLTLEGYETLVSDNGVDGIDLALHNLPDLIVCDITMPRLDGYSVLLELRTTPATADIPFIFVTARAAHQDVRKGMDLGADDYITKPFTRLELLQAVYTRLEKKAIQEQSNQRQTEQWQQALDQEREQRLLKSKLVAMFSHDFRNPLAVIQWSISIVRDHADRLDEQRRLKHLNRAEASVRELLSMLDDMLIISQMESSSFQVTPEMLNIEACLQYLIDEFQIIHGETCSLVFRSDFSDSIRMDPRLLRQIASNLISNAIKYSPQGSEVQVFLEHRDGQVVLTIQDHGIGIPADEQAHLFSAFQRASNVGMVRGTGLGLAIVKQAVDLHGGTIHLDSEVGIGTTVTVRIHVE